MSTIFRSISALPDSRMLPREHGGWSLVLEPIALGLIAAPSRAGIALASAILAAFLGRRPWQLLAVGRLTPTDPVRPAARRSLIMTLAAAAALLVLAAMPHGLTGLWPLWLAIPPGALFVYLDTRGGSRAAAAELAGVLTLACLAATFAALGGSGPGAALSVGTLMAARSVPAVLTLRTFLRGRKGQPAHRGSALIAAVIAVLATLALAVAGQGPWIASLVATALLGRTVWLLGPRPPALRATQLGWIEAALGAGFVVAVGIAERALLP